MIGIQNALITFSDCRYSMIGNDYSNLYWNPENSTPKPTEAELNTIIQRLTSEEPMRILRKKRDELLAETDKYSLPDWSFSNKQAWTDYRQELRDLPSNSNPTIDSNNQLVGVNFPTAP